VPQTTVSLGSEFDIELRQALREVLEDMEAVGDPDWWRVGGINEIALAEIRVGSDLLTLEGSSWVGLTMTGPEDLINHIMRQVAERRMQM
jgi:hypothetical protein